MNMPPYPNCIGKIRKIGSIDGRPRQFTVEDEIVHRQRSASSPKLIYLQKVRFAPPDDKLEYRFTYYMLSRKAGGRWVFGQYSLFVPPADLRAILRKARAKGWKGI